MKRRLFEGGVYCKPCNKNCEFIVPFKRQFNHRRSFRKRAKQQSDKYSYFELNNITIEKNIFPPLAGLD